MSESTVRHPQDTNRKSISRRRPNILVIILDALRAKNVSCYGYPLQTTPHLDAFASRNVLFKRAYTTSTWTIPTHASMLSGLYLSQHRLENIERNRRFHESIVPLPAALRLAGYTTAAFSHNTLFSPAHHFDYFDEFYGLEDLPGSELLSGWLGHGSAHAPRLVEQIGHYLEKVRRPRAFFGAIYQWIQAQDVNTPFFLMANLINTHYPWAPPPHILLKQLGFRPKRFLQPDLLALDPWRFNSGLKQVTAEHRRLWHVLYDGALRHVDRELGQLLNRLQTWRGWRDLVVVITSDHGEMLGDHRDIVGHTLSLHDNILHVPLVIRHPDYPSGLAVEGVVQTVDLYPSVVEWAGVPRDSIPAAQLQRPSYSLAVGAPDRPSGYAFAEEDYTDSYNVLQGLVGLNPAMEPNKYPRQQIAVHSANHKYIWCDDRPSEFYDLVSDPLEMQNLLPDKERSLDLVELQHALAEWRSGLEVFPPQAVQTPDELDAQVEERLRALGYIA